MQGGRGGVCVCVGGIRPNNSCSGSANPLSHPYQLSVSGVESELNIQFAQFNPSSEMVGWGVQDKSSDAQKSQKMKGGVLDKKHSGIFFPRLNCL